MTSTPFTKAFSILALTVALVVALIPAGTPAWADEIVVTKTDDSGAGTLRQAILDANASAGPDTITFNIPLCAGVCLIQPDSALPNLEGGDITIDGYSQPGAVEATATTPAAIKVEIDGTNAGYTHGLYIVSAGNVVRGLAIINFERNGVRLAGSPAADNVISGSHIGTGADGTSDGGNGSSGVALSSFAQQNTIGGDEPGERNVISGNDGEGVQLAGSYNTVSGNYVGTDANGTSSLPNLFGIILTSDAQNNAIGGDAPGERNVISGNTGRGIYISTAGTMSNTVSGNFIGIDASGAYALPNTYIGVSISGGATYNTIGGDASGERNVISGNGNWGVAIQGTGTMSNTVAGNYIGTDASGVLDVGNAEAGVNVSLGAQYNTIGGDTPGERNVIAYNHDGVVVLGSGTSHNTVSGNHIGTDPTGTLDLGNAYHGVYLAEGAQDNSIGDGNVISGNQEYGVFINAFSGPATGNSVFGNYIGTDATGQKALGNGWSGVALANGAQSNTVGPGNVIAHNGQQGVQVGGSGTTGNVITQNSIFGNDKGIELGVGAHGGIEAPVVTNVELGSIEVTGTACALCTVELFANGDDDGEGETYVGSTPAGSGGGFSVTLQVSPGARFLTATGTDPISGTSEFSAPYPTGLSWVLLPVVLRAP